MKKKILLTVLRILLVAVIFFNAGYQIGTIPSQQCDGIDLDIVMGTDTITIDKCNIIMVKSHLMTEWSQDTITGKETIEIYSNEKDTLINQFVDSTWRLSTKQ